MWNEAIGYLGLAVGAAIVTLATWVWRRHVSPYLQENRLYQLVQNLMACAEGLFQTPGSGPARKQWVLDQLRRLGFDLNGYLGEFVENLIKGFMLKLEAEGIVNRGIDGSGNEG